MERSTVLGHRRWSEIADNPSVFVWAHWWGVCSGAVWGGVVLCGCGGNLEAVCEVEL